MATFDELNELNVNERKRSRDPAAFRRRSERGGKTRVIRRRLPRMLWEGAVAWDEECKLPSLSCS